MPGQVTTKAELVLLPADEGPPPPAHLSDDGKEIWREAVRRLGGKVDPADVFVLEAMVEQFLVMREAAEYRRRFGMLQETPAGTYQVAPWVRVQRDASLAFLRLAEQLGLTRLARTRLGVLNAAGQTLVAQLMRELDGE